MNKYSQCKQVERLAQYSVSLSPRENLGDFVIVKALLQSLKKRIRLSLAIKNTTQQVIENLGFGNEPNTTFQNTDWESIFRWKNRGQCPDYVILDPGHFFSIQ